MAGRTVRSGASSDLPPKRIEQIAQVMHESVRQWQIANGQSAAPSWTRAPDWMKEATRSAVKWRIENPSASAADQHQQWVEQKRLAGWSYGKVKSGVRKTHPLLVDYEDLPVVERRKDALAAGVILALAGDLE